MLPKKLRNLQLNTDAMNPSDSEHDMHEVLEDNRKRVKQNTKWR